MTFSLTGFRTVRREGIELTTGFTATVNADLQVGALEETVTVSGVSPLVDTQDVKQQKVVSAELLADLRRREAFGRTAETWEVANSIVFLASDLASYMTGEVLSVSSQHP